MKPKFRIPIVAGDHATDSADLKRLESTVGQYRSFLACPRCGHTFSGAHTKCPECKLRVREGLSRANCMETAGALLLGLLLFLAAWLLMGV